MRSARGLLRAPLSCGGVGLTRAGAQTGAPQPYDGAPRTIASVVTSVVQQPVVKGTLITAGSVLLATFLFSVYKGVRLGG